MVVGVAALPAAWKRGVAVQTRFEEVERWSRRGMWACAPGSELRAAAQILH